MMKYYDEAVRYMGESYSGAWHWLNGLDRHSWLYLLAAACLFGFLCMRGFGSRSGY